MTEPAHLLHCQRILAMPGKHYERRAVEFLNRAEMNALLAAPDRNTWIGRRDHAILSLALQTGLRVSKIVNLRCRDIELGTGGHVHCEGKGRKQRCTPLRQESTQVLTVWLKERVGLDDGPLFPTMRGTKLSRDAMERMVREYILLAACWPPSRVRR
jgi:integrase/recombinase XerD